MGTAPVTSPATLQFVVCRTDRREFVVCRTDRRANQADAAMRMREFRILSVCHERTLTGA